MAQVTVDIPNLSWDASRSKYVRRPQYTLHHLPTGKRINCMITYVQACTDVAQMQMTNCIWGYAVTSLYIALFNPVFIKWKTW